MIKSLHVLHIMTHQKTKFQKQDTLNLKCWLQVTETKNTHRASFFHLQAVLPSWWTVQEKSTCPISGNSVPTRVMIKYLKFDVQLQNYKLQLAKASLLQPTHFKMCNTYFEVEQSLFPVYVMLLLGERSRCLACKLVYW